MGRTKECHQIEEIECIKIGKEEVKLLYHMQILTEKLKKTN